MISKILLGAFRRVPLRCPPGCILPNWQKIEKVNLISAARGHIFGNDAAPLKGLGDVLPPIHGSGHVALSLDSSWDDFKKANLISAARGHIFGNDGYGNVAAPLKGLGVVLPPIHGSGHAALSLDSSWDDFKKIDADENVVMMMLKHIVSDYQHQKGHELVMHVLYHLNTLMLSDSIEHSSFASDAYEKFLLRVAMSLLDTLPSSDNSFSRLLGEVPYMPDTALKLLNDICCSDHGFRKDVRDGDRITQGLGAVWGLIVGHPANRQACLDIALKCAVHSHDDIRAKAIRLVTNKLYVINYISEDIEKFATNMLLSTMDQNVSDNMLSQSEDAAPLKGLGDVLPPIHGSGHVALSLDSSWDDFKKANLISAARGHIFGNDGYGNVAAPLKGLGVVLPPIHGSGHAALSLDSSWDDFKKVNLISAARGHIFGNDGYGNVAAPLKDVLSPIHGSGHAALFLDSSCDDFKKAWNAAALLIVVATVGIHVVKICHTHTLDHNFLLFLVPKVFSIIAGLGLSRPFSTGPPTYGQSMGPTTPNLPVGKWMYEVRITNTPYGLVIHNLIPVMFDGFKLNRVCNNDRGFIRRWRPFIVSHVTCLPPELLSNMHKYWYCLDHRITKEKFWATRFLRHGVFNGLPLMDDYWQQTINAGLPFLKPGGFLSLENILQKYPRGGIYSCDNFRIDVSQALKNDISVRFGLDHVGDTVLHEFLLLLDDGILVDHPEIKSGRHPITRAYFQDFNFKGT